MASSAAEAEWLPAPKAPAASILTTERAPVTRYKRPVILAIVAALAASAGGTVRLAPSERGAAFELDLPAA